MSLKALADAVISRDTSVGQKRDTPVDKCPTDENPSGTTVPPDLMPDNEPKSTPLSWRRGVTPDSRVPLIPDAIRAKIEAIEPEAQRLGWPPELLWNSVFWGQPRGLAAVMDVDDEIVEVGPDEITILVCKKDLQKFRRRQS